MGNAIRDFGEFEAPVVTINLTDDTNEWYQELERQVTVNLGQTTLIRILHKPRTSLRRAIRRLKCRKFKKQPKEEEQCAICLNKY